MGRLWGGYEDTLVRGWRKRGPEARRFGAFQRKHIRGETGPQPGAQTDRPRSSPNQETHPPAASQARQVLSARRFHIVTNREARDSAESVKGQVVEPAHVLVGHLGGDV